MLIVLSPIFVAEAEMICGHELVTTLKEIMSNMCKP